MIDSLGNSSSKDVILVLLVFGNITDTFTDRTADFCAFNYTILNEFCPPGVDLTPDNFISEYTYFVKYLSFPNIYFDAFFIGNAISLN